ncbi:2-phosphosulfolactate phosphatase [Oceanobacillus limi]|uniref:Probable 2-phosphosulfolactate phosphatase n=2 Tax=Oceanobacillus limi TaxID=930131 RepID=A0A1I0G1P9_9BACI|nr:2-phosphosulfolactate phosphatase [Oceanobacillus limi]
MNEEKVAVVFDVLLATSTIAACFFHGAKKVIPVLDEAEARSEAMNYSPEEVCLVGEYNGKTIDGFLDPYPLFLKHHVHGKTVILSTTNGTMAIRKSASARKVYIASLLNGASVAQALRKEYKNETIVIVCSGSRNRFCLEDFYGAGYFIDYLVRNSGDDIVNLTDSARAAQLFYANIGNQALPILRQSHVGKMLENVGLTEELEFVSQRNVVSAVPQYSHGIVVAEKVDNHQKMKK